MKIPWLKNKTYGYCWVPATWQGWAIITIWALLNLGTCLWLAHNSTTKTEALVSFLPAFILLTLLLITIIHKTSGEKHGWRWGDNLDDDKNNGEK